MPPFASTGSSSFSGGSSGGGAATAGIQAQIEALINERNAASSGNLSSLIASLGPSEEASRTALADQFRIAGGGQGGALQSGAFANAARRNEQDILGNRSQTIAKHDIENFRNQLSLLGLNLDASNSAASQQFQQQDLQLRREIATAQQNLVNARSSDERAFQQQQLDLKRRQLDAMTQQQQRSAAGRSTGGSTGAPPPPPEFDFNAYDQSFLDNGGGSGGSGVLFNPVSGSFESAPSQAALSAPGNTFQHQVVSDGPDFDFLEA